MTRFDGWLTLSFRPEPDPQRSEREAEWRNPYLRHECPFEKIAWPVAYLSTTVIASRVIKVPHRRYAPVRNDIAG
jgi:hypothetical protein